MRDPIVLAILGTALCLSSCGILPRVAQQTTAAAIAPVATSARAVSKSLELTSRNIAASAAVAERSSRQASMAAAQTRAAMRAANQRSRQAARLAERNAALRKHASANSGDDAPFDILPATVLAELTTTQAALQRAAQTAALTAPVGEEIYWEDAGRTGSAMAQDEKPMGGFVCRTFVQTVQLDLREESGSTTACKNPDGVWEAPLARTEGTP